MKILLTNAMADELLNNEYQIKNQLGAYRPHYDPFTKSYLPVIKCWPIEDFNGKFNQEREVIPGMETDVYDIAIATIHENVIQYKLNGTTWKPFYKEPEIQLDNFSILIYTPKFNNDTIFITTHTLPELFNRLKDYQIVNDSDLEVRNTARQAWNVFFLENIDNWFKKYQGMCTYILLGGDSVIASGKFDNKKEW